ncbi:hypothetical protein [Actinoallomurus sp. CA-150999]|uniref:hypothetical protein n=1 Tax=Actinoallomurus sp. CA-150999 TaxID=3239887 RepID=UPI003D8A74E6
MSVTGVKRAIIGTAAVAAIVGGAQGVVGGVAQASSRTAATLAASQCTASTAGATASGNCGKGPASQFRLHWTCTSRFAGIAGFTAWQKAPGKVTYVCSAGYSATAAYIQTH